MSKAPSRFALSRSFRLSALCAALSVAALSCSSGSKCLSIPPCPSNRGFDANTCECDVPLSPTGNASCDPLSAQTNPVILSAGDIVAAGRDPADGTVYVMTSKLSVLRLFVGAGDILSEVFELGTGQGQDGATQFWTFNCNDDEAMPVTVEVQNDDSGLRMGVVKGAIDGKGFDVGSVGVVLDPIASDTAAALPAETTQTFHVEFSGANSSREDIVVVAPDHTGSFAGFRIFYGTADALVEQSGTVTVSRGLSIPTTTTIVFTLDGSPATLQYGAAGDSLSAGGRETPLTSIDTTGAMFECLR